MFTPQIPLNVSFQIKLPVFEGPFDLLLFFIERDELDIANIPIASITKDFLDYIRFLEASNLEVASEFIVVAATLMRIKAKMLLPTKEKDQSGNEIDPREELSSKLIAYRQFKEIVQELSLLENERSKQYERGFVMGEWSELYDLANTSSEWESLSLFKLMKAYEKILAKIDQKKSKAIHKIRQYSYNITTQKQFILDKFRIYPVLDFEKIFNESEERIHAIVTFLAILELLNQQTITIVSHPNEINSFHIKLNINYN